MNSSNAECKSSAEQSLAELVKSRRQYLGYTVRQLATEVGCSYQFIHALESGRKTWTDKVQALAQALGVPESLIRRFDPNGPNAP